MSVRAPEQQTQERGAADEEPAAVDQIDAARPREPRLSPGSVRRASPLATWEERCGKLFEDLRKPARVMIARAFGRALSADEVEDVYANAWTSTLAALRGREREMDDEDLRAYLLTAVARHASKEMRRRSRKPISALEDSQAQVLSDLHDPTPEERAVGSESGSLARDVLSSLPRRRRTVMLLRYGWGLGPKEVCGLVEGLSPRAYRKEVTRGVEQMIEGLRQAESGEWCISREPMLRDYVSGTADSEVRLQVTRHIDHCRSCHQLIGRLEGQLHELGSSVAWTAAVGSVGERRLVISERIGSLVDRGRDGAQGLLDSGESGVQTLGTIGASGGGRGAGAAGAGALAKLAGLGAAGKATVACLGASVAATACVAGGVVPGVGPGQGGSDREVAGGRPAAVSTQAELAPSRSVDAVDVSDPVPAPLPGSGADSEPERQAAEKERTPIAPEGAPAQSPAPTAPPTQQEFGLPAAATASGAGSVGGGGGDVASGGDVAREFGP